MCSVAWLVIFLFVQVTVFMVISMTPLIPTLILKVGAPVALAEMLVSFFGSSNGASGCCYLLSRDSLSDFNVLHCRQAMID